MSLCPPDHNRLQRFWGRADDLSIPLIVHWDLTFDCNYRCKHCYLSCHDAAGDLTTDEVVRILDELAAAGTLYLVWSGGEALLRPDFFELAAEARKREFALRVYTNGSLISPQVADELAALNLLAVDVSLYGASAETHDAVTRSPGSFERALRAARLLRERGVHVGIKSPLLREVLGEFEALARLADQVGDEWTFDPLIVGTAENRRPTRDYCLRGEDLRRLYASPRFDGMEPHPLWDQNDPVCGAGRTLAYIAPDGTVKPCVTVPVSGGNLRQQSFQAIWRKAPVFREMRQANIGCLEKCVSCEYAGFCGPCPAMAYVEQGDFWAPADSMCMLAQARYMAWMARQQAEETAS